MGPGTRPMGPLARAKKKWRTTPARSVPPRQTGATFCFARAKGPMGLGPRPMASCSVLLYYYAFILYYYIILYIILYISYIILYIF